MGDTDGAIVHILWIFNYLTRTPFEWDTRPVFERFCEKVRTKVSEFLVADTENDATPC